MGTKQLPANFLGQGAGRVAHRDVVECVAFAEQQMSELKNLRQQMAVMSAVLGKLQTNGEPGAQR